MIKDWLKRQLVPEKRNDGLWPGFADTLQTVYEEQVEPLLERISNRKSFFSMHPDDLDTRINEYGRFFNIGETGKASRPILLAQRIDEVHFKGTDRPIISTFWREFGNLPVTWEPLYAPVDQDRFPYGVFFTTAAGVEVAQESYGEFFLTSRGTINVDLNKLYEIYGYAEQDELVKRLISDFDRIVAPLLPLEIVFDGITLRLDFWLEEAREQIQVQQISSSLSRAYVFKAAKEHIKQHVTVQYSHEISPLHRSVEAFVLSHDSMPADAWRLDFQSIIPPILPSDSIADSRLRINGSKLFIETLGQWGCVVEFSDGSIQRFAFPGCSAAAVLPFSTTVYPAGIRKVTYCAEHDSEHVAIAAPERNESAALKGAVICMPHGLLGIAENQTQLNRDLVVEKSEMELKPVDLNIQPDDATLDNLPIDIWLLDKNIPK